MKPVFSIIVPNYNHASFLKKRLDSIFNQTFKDFEVIFLDDASTDTSVAILKSYQDDIRVSHLIINKENSGSPFKQWEKGIALAKGTYIWIAESDDYCEYTFLQHIWNFKQNETEDLGIIYTQSIDINEKGAPLQNRIEVTKRFTPNIWLANFILEGEEFVNNYLKNHNVIPNASAVVFKKDLIKNSTISIKVLNMRMCGDWLLWIKLCTKSNVGFVAAPLNYFRMHPNATRNNGDRKIRILRLLEESVIRKFLDKNFSLDQNKEIAELYKNWYQQFSKKHIANPKFYKIVIHKYAYLTFLGQFIFKKKES